MRRPLRTLVIATVILLGTGVASCATAHAPATGTSVATTGAITVDYGDAPSQFGVLHLPDMVPPRGTVVLVHGGFWGASYGLDLMDPLVDDLVARDYAVFNVEYRRIGETGGGVPGTLHDVAASMAALAGVAAEYRLDLDHLAVVGHSAGGHLASWVGEHGELRPRLVIGLASVSDLVAGAEAYLGNGAVQAFVGAEPADDPAAYALAQPDLAAVPTLLVHGDADPIVPVEQSTAAAAAGVGVRVVPGDDHFDVIDPASASWAVVVTALETMRSG